MRRTAAPSGAPQYTGWCLDKEDLCVAKLGRGYRIPMASHVTIARPSPRRSAIVPDILFMT
jgi:hypothetical protein